MVSTGELWSGGIQPAHLFGTADEHEKEPDKGRAKDVDESPRDDRGGSVVLPASYLGPPSLLRTSECLNEIAFSISWRMISGRY